jgi:spore germination cell wall hydrolase CwlJ-like protein
MADALTLSKPLDGLRRTARHWRDRSRALVRAYPRETIGAGVLGFVGFVALGSFAVPHPGMSGAQAAPPAPPPLILQNVAPQQALKVNAEIPLTGGPNPAAAPFAFKGSASARAQALNCLASAVYYEAGNQDADGERAVAQVVLNRVRHPAFPNSICGVVYQGSTRSTGCQFTFTCDGSMERRPVPALWNRARQVASEMLNGGVYTPIGHATHYHANYVVPYWASSLVKTSVEGAHIFYRWAGGWGRPTAFSDHWSGREGNPAQLRLAALSAPHTVATVKTADATVEKLEDAGAKVMIGKDGRVRMLFTPQAREAVEKAKVTPYVERVAASDNLKFALQGASPQSEQRPFGRDSEGVGTEAQTSTTQ